MILGARTGVLREPQFQRRGVRFNFGASWDVEKYDGSTGYRKGLERLNGSRAVDFIAALAGTSLFFIEAKDYRGCWGPRPRDEELTNAVAAKVRDSIGGLIGVHRNTSEPTRWTRYVDLLVNRARDVRIVLWIDEDAPATATILARHRHARRQRDKTGAQATGELLKKKLRWLTSKVFLASLGEHKRILPNLAASSLPGAGQPDQ